MKKFFCDFFVKTGKEFRRSLMKPIEKKASMCYNGQSINL